MSEPCSKEPGQSCHNDTKVALLERRVKDLENGQEAEATFRDTYQKEREERLVTEALLREKVDRMDAKIDILLSYKSEQENKPNVLVSGVKDKLIGAVIAAIGAGVVAAVVCLIKVLG